MPYKCMLARIQIIWQILNRSCMYTRSRWLCWHLRFVFVSKQLDVQRRFRSQRRRLAGQLWATCLSDLKTGRDQPAQLFVLATQFYVCSRWTFEQSQKHTKACAAHRTRKLRSWVNIAIYWQAECHRSPNSVHKYFCSIVVYSVFMFLIQYSVGMVYVCVVPPPSLTETMTCKCIVNH